MTTRSSSSPGEPTRAASDGSQREAATSPRAFAIGTGYLFQSVGIIFLLGGCCSWALIGYLVEQATVPSAHWTGYFLTERMPAAVLTVCLAVTVIGGVGLVGVGIGLQGEQRGSGRAAVMLCCCMALVYWGATTLLAIGTDSWSYTLTAAAFGVVSILLLLLASRSASVLRRFPPPLDQHVVTDDDVTAYRNKPRA